MRLAVAFSVGSEHLRVADSQIRMPLFVFSTREHRGASALPSTAAQERICREVRLGPIADTRYRYMLDKCYVADPK